MYIRGNFYDEMLSLYRDNLERRYKEKGRKLTSDAIQFKTKEDIFVKAEVDQYLGGRDEVLCHILLKHIKRIDEDLDQIFNDVISLSESKWSVKSELINKREWLLSHKEEIRNIEFDIEEFIIHNGRPEKAFNDSLINMLRQLHNTFSSCYSLIDTKIKTINSSQVVYANITISIVATIISIVALLVN